MMLNCFKSFYFHINCCFHSRLIWKVGVNEVILIYTGITFRTSSIISRKNYYEIWPVLKWTMLSAKHFRNSTVIKSCIAWVTLCLIPGMSGWNIGSAAASSFTWWHSVPTRDWKWVAKCRRRSVLLVGMDNSAARLSAVKRGSRICDRKSTGELVTLVHLSRRK